MEDDYHVTPTCKDFKYYAPLYKKAMEGKLKQNEKWRQITEAKMENNENPTKEVMEELQNRIHKYTETIAELCEEMSKELDERNEKFLVYVKEQQRLTSTANADDKKKNVRIKMQKICIGRQIRKGIDVKEIMDTVVGNYVKTTHRHKFRYVIVVAIPPPVPSKEFGEIDGPIRESLLHTTQVNDKLKVECEKHGLHFVNPYDGVMDFSKSDGSSCIGNKKAVLKLLHEYILKLILGENKSG